MSGLIVVACSAAVALGIVRLRGMPADAMAYGETECESLGLPGEQAEPILTAPLEQDPRSGLLSMGADHAESGPALDAGSVHPVKRHAHTRPRRSPRRGGLKSSMRASALHAAIRPDKQFPAPANARSATSGSPVAVFTVLRN
jgi:hypothetical protein